MLSNLHPFLSKLTVNGRFIQEFLAAEAPCFTLGLVEERGQACGFMALRPPEAIPTEVLNLGFRFGHCMLGAAAFEVAHFAFEFYGFATYNVLVNPNNLIVRTVLCTMIESGDYFFFTVGPNQATAFRSEIGEQNLVGLKTSLPIIQRSTTTETQYLSALAQFRRQPTTPGEVLNWVCRDEADGLNLTQDRLALSPA